MSNELEVRKLLGSEDDVIRDIMSEIKRNPSSLNKFVEIGSKVGFGTLLHFSCLWNKPKVVSFLLSQKDVDVTKKIEFKVSKFDGLTAKQIAEMNGESNIVTLFEQYEREQASRREAAEREKLNQFLEQLGFDNTIIRKIEEYGTRRVEDFDHFGKEDWDNLALSTFQKNKIVNKIAHVDQDFPPQPSKAAPIPSTQVGQYFSPKSVNYINQHLLEIKQKKTLNKRIAYLTLLEDKFEEEKLENDLQLFKNIESMLINQIKDPFDYDIYSSTWCMYFPNIPPQPSKITPKPSIQATNNITRILDTPPSNLRFNPIYGIADIKVTSLMESITPLVTNHLVKHIDKYTQDAIDLFSEKPLPTTLNLDETVAIHIYTKEWPEHTHSLYYILNTQLHSKDRSMIKPFFPYIKILLTGITKLDKTPGITYRGVGLNLSNDYTIGDKIQWWSFTSTTIDGNACQNFLEKSPERTLFQVDQKSGVNIQKFSEYPEESEILMWPMTLLVKNKFMVVKGLWMVELEEIGNPLVNL